MDSDQKYWLTLILGLALIVGGVIVGSQHAYNNRLQIMTQAGYEEGVLPGYGGVCWVKVKP